jgi:hypothetical protein
VAILAEQAHEQPAQARIVLHHEQVHGTLIAPFSERMLKVTVRRDVRPFDGTAHVDHDSVVRRGEPPVEPNPLPPLAPEFEYVGSDHRFTIVEPKEPVAKPRRAHPLRPRDTRPEG